MHSKRSIQADNFYASLTGELRPLGARDMIFFFFQFITQLVPQFSILAVHVPETVH